MDKLDNDDPNKFYLQTKKDMNEFKQLFQTTDLTSDQKKDAVKRFAAEFQMSEQEATEFLEAST